MKATLFQLNLKSLIFLAILSCLALAQIDYINEDYNGDNEDNYNEGGSSSGDNSEGQDQDSLADEDGLNQEDGDHGHVETDGDDHNDNDNNQHQGGEGGHQSHYLNPSQPAFWINILFSAFLTCVGAFCSGMTVGLMSIETMQLEIMSISGNNQEKDLAKRILSVVHDHHLWLVTLLLANAMALESLPIVVHSLMPAWAAILFSTIIVLIVAEIVPQAVCTGPKKMTIAYYACPIIQVMTKILYVLAYPMAKGLDKLLGEHHHQRIQHKDFANFLTGGSQNLKQTEKLLLTSILELRAERVPKIMVPVKDLYMLELNERLTASKIAEINKKDYSYILIYKGEDRSNVVGVIKTKEFALKYLKAVKREEKYHKVDNIFGQKQHELLSVYEDTNLLEMLMLFQAKSQRFALVIGKKKKIEPGIESIMYSKSDMVAKNTDGRILGVIFLYNIFEQIAEFNEQVVQSIATGEPAPLTKPQKNVEMNELKKPLL